MPAGNDGDSWRDPLVVAAMLTVIGLLLALAMLDAGLLLAWQTLLCYEVLWAGNIVATWVRRDPSAPERWLVATSPLTVMAGLVTVKWLAR